MNQIVIMSIPSQQFQHLSSFPQADQVDHEEETDTVQSLEECEERLGNEERYGKLKCDELDSSMALNDLSDAYTRPLRDGWTSSWRKKGTIRETTNSVQSILKNGSGDGDELKRRKSHNSMPKLCWQSRFTSDEGINKTGWRE